MTAAQEALAIAYGLVLARQPSVDDLLKRHRYLSAGRASGRREPALIPCGGSADMRVGRRAHVQLLFLTRKYHSHSSRTCLAV